MLSVVAARAYEEMVPVPRIAVKFPLELPVPEGFEVDDPSTWPRVEGEIEYVGGKLLYMPPTADRQQDTSADVVTALGVWRRAHPEFAVGGNEAGMLLAGETRGADAAVWRKSDLGRHEGKYRRVAPLLAVEVQGELEDEQSLREKARWYSDRGVRVVWLVFPLSRTVAVLTPEGERDFRAGDVLPEHPDLPALVPSVGELFEQLAGDR